MEVKELNYVEMMIRADGGMWEGNNVWGSLFGVWKEIGVSREVKGRCMRRG